LQTRNGGTTWEPQNSGTAESLFAVACADIDVCWAGGGFPDDFAPVQVEAHPVNGPDEVPPTGPTLPHEEVHLQAADRESDVAHVFILTL
jgi:hypothetical protein